MNSTVLAAIIGVGGTVIVGVTGFWAGVRNTTKTTSLALRAVELTEQGQVTDRYSTAVEQLGSDKLDVRIGGIYALERVARDSPRDHPTVIEVLTAFVREHSREQGPVPPPDHAPENTRPDMQAALTVIGRRDVTHDRQRIDLMASNLIAARLTDANLAGAYLNDADLTRALLWDADLSAAWLIGTNCTGARLMRAILTGAHFGGTDLTGANLTSANLTGANLYGTDLTRAILTTADLTGAILPEGQPVPDGWVRDHDSGRLRRASEDTGNAAT
jgi:hypothetical protein